MTNASIKIQPVASDDNASTDDSSYRTSASRVGDSWGLFSHNGGVSSNNITTLSGGITPPVVGGGGGVKR